MPKDYDLLRQKLDAIEVDLLKDFTERNLERLRDLQRRIAMQLDDWGRDAAATPDKRYTHGVALARLLRESLALERCFEVMSWSRPGEWRQFLDEHGMPVFLDEQGDLRQEHIVAHRDGSWRLSLPGQDAEVPDRWRPLLEKAHTLWVQDPRATITEVANHPELLAFLTENYGETFSESHRRRILSAVAPATVPGPGRPKKTRPK